MIRVYLLIVTYTLIAIACGIAVATNPFEPVTFWLTVGGIANAAVVGLLCWYAFLKAKPKDKEESFEVVVPENPFGQEVDTKKVYVDPVLMDLEVAKTTEFKAVKDKDEE